MTASPGRQESFPPGGAPLRRTARRWTGRATLLLAVTAMVLTGVGVVPASAVVISGGWSPLGNGGGPTIPALNDRVYTILPVGQKLYFGGHFTNAGGIGAADLAAIWDGTSWSAVGAGLPQIGSVNALAVSGSTVFAGGSFDNAGGDPQADNLAMWNGSHWTSVDGTSFSGPVYALKIVGSTLFVAGAFDNAHGLQDADGIVAYDIGGNTWSNIMPANEGIVGTVSSLAVSDGGLYVGATGATNIAGIHEADFLARYDLTSHIWSAVGSPGPGASAINNRVRGLFADGSNVYVVGDFINAAGIDAADKVAKWNGAQWSALGNDGGNGGFFGETQGVFLDSVLVVHSPIHSSFDTLFVGGLFLNAGGQPLDDVIAAFQLNGQLGWRNVGTNADGTNGPGGGTVLALASSRNRLYEGSADTAFGGSALNGFAASLFLRQPDARIAFKQGTPVGENRYNTTGLGQTKSVDVASGATATFTIGVQNDGYLLDAFTAQAPGNGGGFTVKYFLGNHDATADVVAGTFDFGGGFVGGARTHLTMKVTVGNGVHSGTTRSWIFTTSTTGPTPTAKDAVKATVTVK